MANELSAPYISYQNNAYEVTSRGVVVHPDRILVKTSTKIDAGRQKDAQTINALRAYILLR